MSSVADVSSTLGEFMLKGWVLMDRSCPTSGCAVPLMRSPKGQTPVVQFCANCDFSPDVDNQSRVQDKSELDISTSSESQFSRTSTPPTEFSEALSSPVLALPPETDESRHRREQSDRASAEIGNRLLKGWAMLAEECLNTNCFGVPLVRPPKTSGGKSPRKECVLCGTTYITESDWAGREQLVPTAQSQSSNISINNVAIPRSIDKGKAPDITPQITDGRQKVAESKISKQPANVELFNTQTLPQTSNLQETTHALQFSLRTLTCRLVSITSMPSIDPGSVDSTLDAISKVTQALAQVQQLQRDETMSTLFK